MTLIEELQKWQKDLEDLAEEKIRAEGRLEQAMTELKRLGFPTLELAKAELDRLLAEKERIKLEAVNLTAVFKEKYAEFIE